MGCYRTPKAAGELQRNDSAASRVLFMNRLCNAGNTCVTFSPTSPLQCGDGVQPDVLGQMDILYVGKGVQKFFPLVVLNVELPKILRAARVRSSL